MRKLLDNRVVPAVLEDVRLTSTEVRIYLQMQRHPFQTLGQHAELLQVSYETVRRSVQKLIRLGWVLPMEQGARPVFIPWMPIDVERSLIGEVERVRNEVVWAGEWLLKAKLDVVVADLEYRDNVRLRWLVTGDGGRALEIDRWFKRAKVAIEFQGNQHFHPAASFTSDAFEFDRRQLNDTIKAGLCTRLGIHYVEFVPRDLTFEAITRKLNGLLPLKPVPQGRPLIATLTDMGLSYMNATGREERRIIAAGGR